MRDLFFILAMSVGFICLIAFITSYANPKPTYRIFHYTNKYSDGSQNEMICIFNNLTGEFKSEILD